MPPRLSAIDAVSPAFEQTKQQLFKPFRFGHWARLAVVSLLTGEFAGGGGGGWGGGNFSAPRGGGKQTDELLWLANPAWDRLRDFLPWVLLGVGVLIALALVWIYIASVYRFVLFDTVLHNRCELRPGWRRWQRQGTSYFFWVIGLALAIFAALAVLVGGPIYIAWRTGVFRQPKEHLALLVLGGVALFLVLVGLMVLAAVVALFAKDFAVPLMALESLSVMNAWRRLLPMLGADKLAYGGYILMKVVLAVGGAILFGIINLIVLLALLIPLGVGGLALFLIAKAAGLSWNFATVSIVVVLGAAVLGWILYVIAFVSTPALVFFQSYALHFFGSRYATLGALVFRPSIPPPLPPAPAPSRGEA